MKTIKQIYESIILEAMSLEDIWEKYYKQDVQDFDKFKKIHLIDPTSISPTKKGKYLDWLVKKAYKNNPKIAEDSSKIKEDLMLFDKNYRHINKQITQIKDQYELSKLVSEFRKKKESGEIDLSRSELKKDAEKLFEDSNWLIIHPKTEEAAKFYGANTRWCTAAEKDNMFEEYNKDGPLYILINKKENEKFQFHFQDQQYMDEEDNPITIQTYSKFPTNILDKLIELANINKNVIAFIITLPELLKEKYLKIFEKEYKQYNISLNLIKQSTIGNLEKVKEALKNGANIHIDSDKALRNAAQHGHFEIVKFLVENEANIHADSDWALRVASTLGHFETVKFLVENGANIHAINDSALTTGSANGYFEIVKFLIENEANIHTDNDAPLRWAVYHGHFDVVKFLVENGANIHANNDWSIRNASNQNIKDYFKSIIDKEKK